jgi:hypothetical protein
MYANNNLATRTFKTSLIFIRFTAGTLACAPQNWFSCGGYFRHTAVRDQIAPNSLAIARKVRTGKENDECPS